MSQFECKIIQGYYRHNGKRTLFIGNKKATGDSVPGDSVRNYLDPASWRCTMIWAAYLGLPLSLAGVGAVLGLEKQKLDTGRDLIRYFCRPCAPTQSNGERT